MYSKALQNSVFLKIRPNKLHKTPLIKRSRGREDKIISREKLYQRHCYVYKEFRAFCLNTITHNQFLSMERDDNNTSCQALGFCSCSSTPQKFSFWTFYCKNMWGKLPTKTENCCQVIGRLHNHDHVRLYILNMCQFSF